MMEVKIRSWVKAVIWRMLGIVILGSISYLFTESWVITGKLTVIFHVIRLVMYYYYERVWDEIEWGRKNS